MIAADCIVYWTPFTTTHFVYASMHSEHTKFRKRVYSFLCIAVKFRQFRDF